MIFRVTDCSNEIDCAAYEPTGSFRNVVEQLETGDVVEVAGGVRPPFRDYGLTVNLEKLSLLRLSGETVNRNPLCFACGIRMESAGRSQGYRCKRCNAKVSSKIKIKVHRKLKPKLYIPPPGARRHLAKPHQRYGLEKDVKPNSCKSPVTFLKSHAKINLDG